MSVGLRLNKVESDEDIFNLQDTKNDHFVDTAVITQSTINLVKVTRPHTSFIISAIINIIVSPVKFSHTRTVYTVLDLLGDYGGLQEMFFLILSFIVAPYAEHSF
jgi:hypothetical protein